MNINKMKDIIANELGVDEQEVTMDASFIDDLGADSLDVVEIAMAFEEEFGIEIYEDEAEKMTRVKDAINLVERKLREKTASKE